MVQVQLELQDVQVPQDSRDLRVHPVNQDSVDHPDPRVSRVLQEHRVSQEPQGLDGQEQQDLKDPRVYLDLLVLKVRFTCFKLSKRCLGNLQLSK